MKKLIVFVSLTGMLMTGFSQTRVVYNSTVMRPGNSLIVDTRGMRDFTVYIDNRKYPSNGDALTINSLYNGDHMITIYERKREVLGMMGKHRQELVYNASVRLKPGIETSIMVRRNGRAELLEKPLYVNSHGKDKGKWIERKYNSTEIRN